MLPAKAGLARLLRLGPFLRRSRSPLRLCRGALASCVISSEKTPADLFLAPAKGPQSAPKGDRVRDQVVVLRKQNLSIYDTTPVSPAPR